jgi:hypothetical protein
MSTMSTRANVRMLVGRTLVLWGPAAPIPANDDDGAAWRVASHRNGANSDDQLVRKSNVNIRYLRVVGA